MTNGKYETVLPRIKNVLVAKIDDTRRLRAVRLEAVEKIAASMEVEGGGKRLIQPITVRPLGDGYKLVAGAHRLAAAKLLGWAEIAAIIEDDLTNDDARIIEIEENLRRLELSPGDEAEFVTTRILLAIKKKDGLTKLPQPVEIRKSIEKEEFLSEIASLRGVHIETVRRAVLRRVHLDHVWAELKNTSAFESGMALDRLRKKFNSDAPEVIARAKNDFENNIEVAMDAIAAERKTKGRSSISATEAGKNLDKAWKLCPDAKRQAFVKKHADELISLLKQAGLS
jgi:ParB family chromosome partitioning protein